MILNFLAKEWSSFVVTEVLTHAVEVVAEVEADRHVFDVHSLDQDHQLDDSHDQDHEVLEEVFQEVHDDLHPDLDPDHPVKILNNAR